MLTRNLICRLFGGIAFAALSFGAASAVEIWSPDGNIVYDDDSTPRFLGGTELFKFRYHPPTEVAEDGLLPLASAEPVTLDTVELFRQLPRGLEDIEKEGLAAVRKQSAGGGIAATFSDIVLEEIAVLQENCVVGGAPIENANIKPVYSSLRLNTNPIRTGATLEVFSYKRLTCTEGDVNIDIPLIRRWVMALEDGLQQGDIDGEIGGVEMKYKMFARGENIELIAYYSNLTLTGKRWRPTMRLISGFDEFGNMDPRDKYYDRNAASCIDIDFRKKPPNGATIWRVAPRDMQFCARGCIPGDISATK